MQEMKSLKLFFPFPEKKTQKKTKFDLPYHQREFRSTHSGRGMPSISNCQSDEAGAGSCCSDIWATLRKQYLFELAAKWKYLRNHYLV